MEELSEEQVEEFKEAFSLFDQEGKGFIYTKELGTVLRSLGIHTSDKEKSEFINKYDQNGEGVIRFKDFLEIIIFKIADTDPIEELIEAFKLFDTENSEFLTITKFKEDLKTYCPDMGDDEILNLCEFLKKGNDFENHIGIDEAAKKIISKVNEKID